MMINQSPNTIHKTPDTVTQIDNFFVWYSMIDLSSLNMSFDQKLYIMICFGDAFHLHEYEARKN